MQQHICDMQTNAVAVALKKLVCYKFSEASTAFSPIPVLAFWL
jgi:hypothetical protein